MEGWIKDFFNLQLQEWELARTNFIALKEVEKKCFKYKDLEGYVQYNPARSVSTLAKTDKESVDKRPCFLCQSNRPAQQNFISLDENWQLLVNPFPILPYHFTIASRAHIPQSLNLEEGEKLARKLTGLVVFYNDDGAGASAPDHLHFQAVPIESLPLIKKLESDWPEETGNGLKIPFHLLTDKNKIIEDKNKKNVFIWVSPTNGEIRILAIPRRTHRPKEFFLKEPERRAISPGAIDMAGVMVTPYKSDFDLITEEDIKNIYSQVAYTIDD